MRARHESRGYTILEVMLFLAISGVMFIMAAAFVSGKQSKSEFRQGINDINTQVQQVMNDVSNGFYPSNNNFICKVIGGAAPQLTAGTGAGQGANTGCIFLGKVMQFRVAGSDGKDYNVFSVAGRQYKVSPADGTLSTTFAEAQPVPVYGAGFDLTDKKTLQWGVRVTSMKSNGTPINGVGFFGSFGAYASQSNRLQSGSQDVTVVAVPGSATPSGDVAGDDTQASMAVHIPADVMADANRLSNPNIVLCLDNGNGQYGTLKIGGGGGQRLATAIQISNTQIAGCPA